MSAIQTLRGGGIGGALRAEQSVGEALPRWCWLVPLAMLGIAYARHVGQFETAAPLTLDGDHARRTVAALAIPAFAGAAWLAWRRAFGLRTAFFAALGSVSLPVVLIAVGQAPQLAWTAAAVAVALLLALVRAARGAPRTIFAVPALLAVAAALPGALIAFAICGPGPAMVLLRHRRRLCLARGEAYLWLAALAVGGVVGSLLDATFGDGALLGAGDGMLAESSATGSMLAVACALLLAVLVPFGPFALVEYRGSREARLSGDELLQRGAAAVAVGALPAALLSQATFEGSGLRATLLQDGVFRAAVPAIVGLLFVVAVAPYLTAYTWHPGTAPRWQRRLLRSLAAAVFAVGCITEEWLPAAVGVAVASYLPSRRIALVFGLWILVAAGLASGWPADAVAIEPIELSGRAP